MTDREFTTALNAAELMLNGLGEAMATRVAKQWEAKCRELADARAQVERAHKALAASDDVIRELANRYNMESPEGRRISMALASIIADNAAVLGPVASTDRTPGGAT
jgi:hypothetical protein